MIWLILIIVLLILCLFYFINYYIDYLKKKKKLLKYVDKRVSVILGRINDADVKVVGTLRFDINYIGYQSGKSKFYIQNKYVSKGKTYHEDLVFNVFELKYLFNLDD